MATTTHGARTSPRASRTPQSVVNAWLNSAGHKANIENPSFVATGLGAAKAANGAIYWVQDFGFVADGGSPPPPTTTSSSPPPTTTAATTTARHDDDAAADDDEGDHHHEDDHHDEDDDDRADHHLAAAEEGLAGRRARAHVVQGRDRRSRRLVLTTRVVDSGKPVRSASVKCAAVLGKRHLRVVVNAYRSGRARCAWRLPGSVSAGSFANGWVSVRAGSSRGLQAFAVKLR